MTEYGPTPKSEEIAVQLEACAKGLELFGQGTTGVARLVEMFRESAEVARTQSIVGLVIELEGPGVEL